MAFNVNPFNWKSFNLSMRNKAFDESMREFQKQITDFCTQVQTLFTPAGLSAVLNGSAGILRSALAAKVVDLGTITTDQTVNVLGAANAYVRLTSATTQTRTLTLQNLPQGALVSVVFVSTANTLTLKMSATDTSGNTYTITGVNTVTGSTVNMVSTGQSITGGTTIFLGETGFISNNSTPDLTALLA